MRLAFYTYSYTDRLELPTVECLERIARTGYSGIDVSGTHGPSDDPRSFDAELRKLTRTTAERLKLRAEGIITHADLTGSLADSGRTPLDLVGSTDLAVDLGADLVTFHLGGLPAGADRGKLWQQVVKHVRAAAEDAAQRHVRLAIDLGVWPEWLTDTPDELARLLDDVDHPNFGVNFDPCYLTLAGHDPAEFARRFKDRIVHAHLKDHVGQYPDFEHRIPGQGDMDYVAAFAALAEVGFDDAAAMECFVDMPLEEACDRGYEAMRAAAEKAGLTVH
jgi:sugar phosphate isomerase/epimerase